MTSRTTFRILMVALAASLAWLVFLLGSGVEISALGGRVPCGGSPETLLRQGKADLCCEDGRYQEVLDPPCMEAARHQLRMAFIPGAFSVVLLPLTVGLGRRRRTRTNTQPVTYTFH